MRLWLHYWEIFGIERAQQYFVKQYIKERGHVKSHNAHLENVICGKLDYMRMVMGENNSAYKKLKARYDDLIGNNSKTTDKKDAVNTPMQNIIANYQGIKIVPEIPSLKDSDNELLSLLDELINNL